MIKYIYDDCFIVRLRSGTKGTPLNRSGVNTSIDDRYAASSFWLIKCWGFVDVACKSMILYIFIFRSHQVKELFDTDASRWLELEDQLGIFLIFYWSMILVWCILGRWQSAAMFKVPIDLNLWYGASWVLQDECSHV